MFVGPGDEVYEGMIVGENSRSDDMDVNPTRRSSSPTCAPRPPTCSCGSSRTASSRSSRRWSSSASDECVEVTPGGGPAAQGRAREDRAHEGRAGQAREVEDLHHHSRSTARRESREANQPVPCQCPAGRARRHRILSRPRSRRCALRARLALSHRRTAQDQARQDPRHLLRFHAVRVLQGLPRQGRLRKDQRLPRSLAREGSPGQALRRSPGSAPRCSPPSSCPVARRRSPTRATRSTSMPATAVPARPPMSEPNSSGARGPRSTPRALGEVSRAA